MRIKDIFITICICLSLSVLIAEEKKEADSKVPVIKANTWVDAKLKYEMPAKYVRGSKTYWKKSDGFCDSIYRSKTGSIIVRTGIRCQMAGLKPGYYSNASMEWNLKTNKIEVIDVFNWGGGSGGNGTLLAGFKDNPTPSPRHTYDGLAYDSDEDVMYLMLGAFHKAGYSMTDEKAKKQFALDANSTWKYSFKDNKWTQIEGNIRQFWNKNSVQAFEQHLEYWPGGKKLLFHSGTGKYYAEFDIKTQKWAKVKLKNTLPVRTFGARSAWDSKREHWVFRLGEKVGYISPKLKSCSALPDLPKEFSIIPKGRKSWHLYKSIAYISKHDVYIISGATGNDTYVYDHKTKKWVKILGGEIKLPNGYIEYDEKTDLCGLVYQHKAFKFRYVPVLKKTIKN